jgi:oxygen-independent coproporphyrinogen III oxidase
MLSIIEKNSPGRIEDLAGQTVVVPGLYVHIPFCFHKCHYCDFYSITAQTPERMERFVELILREARMWKDRAAATVRPRTIFFGGGTPTMLPLENMRTLLRGLKSVFDLANCDEWTVEANPATVSADYCRMLWDEGVNRMSFGAQSFDRAELAMLERHHDPDDLPRSLELARSAGFERLNVDLIFGIPGQDMDSWARSLEQAISLATEHISAYGLTYEPNTPMAVKKRLGMIRAIDEDMELEMLRHARRRLGEAGLPAYEISNYAEPGAECRHNLLYWHGGDYAGLGPSAASHVQGCRWRNQPHLGQWESGIESGGLPAVDVENLSKVQRARELGMLMLRLTRGIGYADFSARTGLDAEALFSQAIEDLTKTGFLKRDLEAICLTESGLAVADSVAAEFLVSIDR